MQHLSQKMFHLHFKYSCRGRTKCFQTRINNGFDGRPDVEASPFDKSSSPNIEAVVFASARALPVEAVVDAVDGVHSLRVQSDEFALVLLHRRLFLGYRM